MTTTTTAGAVAALLIHGARRRTDAEMTATIADLRTLLADEILIMEIQGWVESGGPDGEQVYCLVDLIGNRLTRDQLLGFDVERVVHRNETAISALLALAGVCRRGGYSGAALWCQDMISALRHEPLNRTVTAPK